MKLFLLFLFLILASFKYADAENPYSIHLEQVTIPGAPKIHSFSFADYEGKWLFVGGRTNGMHGFDAPTAFPKQYANSKIYVVDPSTNNIYSRNIFTDLDYTAADPLRSTNMQYYFDGQKLFMIGGFGYDSTSNSFITFPTLTIIDVSPLIQAIINGSSTAPYIRQYNDERFRVCGGELGMISDFFYLVGGHNFSGSYTQFVNNQVYSNQVKKFKISDTKTDISITDYSSLTDTIQFHRRDMNLAPAIKPDGISKYLILYGGVFTHSDLPFLNPVNIDNSGATVDFGFEQKMSQYTCAYLSAFNSTNGSMYTTFFGGTSLYYFNEPTGIQIRDSLVPFINDITTLKKSSSGISEELISPTIMPGLLGTNAKFILNPLIPHFDNGVIKLNEISGSTFAGYIFGGIKAFLPNNTPSIPSDIILKIYIDPKTIGIQPVNSIVPSQFNLYQNYPNPFNPSTKIKFDVPEVLYVNVTIYNALGQKVSILVEENLVPGSYEIQFSAENLAGGIYFCKVETNKFSEVKKMLLIK